MLRLSFAWRRVIIGWGFYDYYISHNCGATVNHNFYATYNFQPDPGTGFTGNRPSNASKKTGFLRVFSRHCR